MHIARRRGWEIPESRVTPEAAMLNRRGLLAGAGALSIAGALPARAEPNPKFAPGRALTEEKYATGYNNYYEFNDSKNVVAQAQALKQRPWTIAVGGLVKTPRTIDIDDLLKQVQSEERIYRHRCVETWAMTVPWTGFSLAQLLKLAEPLGSAKYVAFETVQDKSAMPGLNSPFYTWPYIEGLAIDEAANDLAFMVTGAGVSWFDDHEEFPLEVPYHEEYELQMLADEQCEDEGRPQAECGHYCDPSKKECPECGSATGFGSPVPGRGTRWSAPPIPPAPRARDSSGLPRFWTGSMAEALWITFGS
jgi:hypothetical protein